jgi:glycosyltransferase involved in cell wall biosynthesis
MIEYYLALRGEGGAQQLMMMSDDPGSPGTISPAFDDQLGDMRLLQNAGFWEIAHRAKSLVLHSPSAAPRIERETGCPVRVLPFANYRAPSAEFDIEIRRQQARTTLGLDQYPDGTIHLGSFGYIDTRTKLHDIVVESAAWLTQWGHSVALHFIGSGRDDQVADLTARAERAGLAGFQVTGYVSEDDFQYWLSAVDLGVQLRISPLLGVSGPLSDLAAYGTPAVASRGLCVDVDPPAFIRSLPNAMSPVLVAEAVQDALRDPMPLQERDRLRKEYLARRSPENYARALLELLEVG